MCAARAMYDDSVFLTGCSHRRATRDLCQSDVRTAAGIGPMSTLGDNGDDRFARNCHKRMICRGMCDRENNNGAGVCLGKVYIYNKMKRADSVSSLVPATSLRSRATSALLSLPGSPFSNSLSFTFS